MLALVRLRALRRAMAADAGVLTTASTATPARSSDCPLLRLTVSVNAPSLPSLSASSASSVDRPSRTLDAHNEVRKTNTALSVLQATTGHSTTTLPHASHVRSHDRGQHNVPVLSGPVRHAIDVVTLMPTVAMRPAP